MPRPMSPSSLFHSTVRSGAKLPLPTVSMRFCSASTGRVMTHSSQCCIKKLSPQMMAMPRATSHRYTP